MIYMLDTNACIEHLRNPACNVGVQMNERWRDEFVLSAITEFELLYGAANSKYPIGEEAKALEFIRRFECVPFNRHAAALAGQLRADLESRGEMIGSLDFLIAVTAIIRGARLITHNTSEFSRVPHLEWEDWH
jgi:tRNA(fMet)-specific endonuclease VapC